MPPLTRKRREINFCGVIGNENGKATVRAAGQFDTPTVCIRSV